MPRTQSITCDHCGKDLTSTGNMPRWRLCLHAEKVPHDFPGGVGVVFSIHIPSPLEDPAYFCNKACLKAWVEKNP